MEETIKILEQDLLITESQLYYWTEKRKIIMGTIRILENSIKKNKETKVVKKAKKDK